MSVTRWERDGQVGRPPIGRRDAGDRKMTTIMLWPDVQREDGHWLPAVSLAKSLKDAGYSVKMMGIPDTAAVVAPYKVPFTEVLSTFFPLGYARERLETGR